MTSGLVGVQSIPIITSYVWRGHDTSSRIHDLPKLTLYHRATATEWIHCATPNLKYLIIVHVILSPELEGSFNECLCELYFYSSEHHIDNSLRIVVLWEISNCFLIYSSSNTHCEVIPTLRAILIIIVISFCKLNLRINLLIFSVILCIVLECIW